MKALLHCFAGLLVVIALGALSLPIATLAHLGRSDTPAWAALLFIVPPLLFSGIVAVLIFRYFRRRDHASSTSLVTAFSFFLWLTLNTLSARRIEAHDQPDALAFWLGFAGPIIVALLVNRLLQNATARHFGKPVPA